MHDVNEFDAAAAARALSVNPARLQTWHVRGRLTATRAESVRRRWYSFSDLMAGAVLLVLEGALVDLDNRAEVLDAVRFYRGPWPGACVEIHGNRAVFLKPGEWARSDEPYRGGIPLGRVAADLRAALERAEERA